MHVVHINEVRALKRLSVRILLVLFTEENPTETRELSLEKIRLALNTTFLIDYTPHRLNTALEELDSKCLIVRKKYPKVSEFYFSGTCPGCKIAKAVRTHQHEVPHFSELLTPGMDRDVE